MNLETITSRLRGLCAMTIASLFFISLLISPFLITVVLLQHVFIEPSKAKTQSRQECFKDGGNEYHEIHEGNGRIRSDCTFEAPANIKYKM